MTRLRNKENLDLPKRWRFTRGAYYYQVPAGTERYWDFKQTYKLGNTFAEALITFQKKAGSINPADDFDESVLLDADSVSTLAVPLNRSGVYFLLKSGKVVYVGRSENVTARISSHMKSGLIPFDSYHSIAAEGVSMGRLEQLYIARFSPEFNRDHTAGIPN